MRSYVLQKLLLFVPFSSFPKKKLFLWGCESTTTFIRCMNGGNVACTIFWNTQLSLVFWLDSNNLLLNFTDYLPNKLRVIAFLWWADWAFLGVDFKQIYCEEYVETFYNMKYSTNFGQNNKYFPLLNKTFFISIVFLFFC